MERLEQFNGLIETMLPNNVIIEDDAGNISVMVRIPKFRICDVIDGGSEKVHPAFIVNGREIDCIYASKYQNVVIDGRACSLPDKLPDFEQSYEECMELCQSKGAGWHMMTVAEWAAIALWSRRNGTMPKGNCDNGKDINETEIKAKPLTWQDGKVIMVATGSGPCTWSHDGTYAGIWDMKGNVNTRVAGYQTVYGEIQIIPDNDAAMHIDQSPASPHWRAVAVDGTLLIPDGKGTTPGSLKWDIVDGVITLCENITNREPEWKTTKFADLGLAPGIEAPEVLKALGLFPAERGGDYDGAGFYVNNSEENRVAYRGGRATLRGNASIFLNSSGAGRFIPPEENIFPHTSVRASYIEI